MGSQAEELGCTEETSGWVDNGGGQGGLAFSVLNVVNDSMEELLRI